MVCYKMKKDNKKKQLIFADLRLKSRNLKMKKPFTWCDRRSWQLALCSNFTSLKHNFKTLKKSILVYVITLF